MVLLPAPAGPTSSTSQGRAPAPTLGAPMSDTLPDADAEVVQDLHLRSCRVDHDRTARRPVGVPQHSGPLPDVGGGLVHLAPHGGLGIYPEGEDQVRRPDLRVVAGLDPAQ